VLIELMWKISECILQMESECRKLLDMKEKNVMRLYEERKDLGRKILCLIYSDRCDGRVLPWSVGPCIESCCQCSGEASSFACSWKRRWNVRPLVFETTSGHESQHEVAQSGRDAMGSEEETQTE
jgi:hypothetical protein